MSWSGRRGWEDKANDYLPDLLGLPELPHLTFDGAARFGSAHWKLGPLEEYAPAARGLGRRQLRRELLRVGAETRPEPTLLVPTESHLGIEEAHVEALMAWARSLNQRDEARLGT